jgi:hypothetical protein
LYSTRAASAVFWLITILYDILVVCMSESVPKQPLTRSAIDPMQSREAAKKRLGELFASCTDDLKEIVLGEKGVSRDEIVLGLLRAQKDSHSVLTVTPPGGDSYQIPSRKADTLQQINEIDFENDEYTFRPETKEDMVGEVTMKHYTDTPEMVRRYVEHYLAQKPPGGGMLRLYRCIAGRYEPPVNHEEKERLQTINDAVVLDVVGDHDRLTEKHRAVLARPSVMDEYRVAYPILNREKMQSFTTTASAALEYLKPDEGGNCSVVILDIPHRMLRSDYFDVEDRLLHGDIGEEKRGSKLVEVIFMSRDLERDYAEQQISNPNKRLTK